MSAGGQLDGGELLLALPNGLLMLFLKVGSSIVVLQLERNYICTAVIGSWRNLDKLHLV